MQEHDSKRINGAFTEVLKRISEHERKTQALEKTIQQQGQEIQQLKEQQALILKKARW